MNPSPPLMRPFSILLSISAFLFLPAPEAMAHAALLQASPGPESVSITPPSRVTLRFTQSVEPAFSRIEVFDTAGNRVDGNDLRVDSDNGKTVNVSLKAPGPGLYTVAWRVVSVDSHAADGAFTFRIRSDADE